MEKTESELRNKIDNLDKLNFYTSFTNEGFEVIPINYIIVSNEMIEDFCKLVKELTKNYNVKIKGRKYKKISCERIG